VLDLDDLRRQGITSSSTSSQDGDYIAHRTAEIIALRKPLRRLARAVRHPAHGVRAVKRMIRRILGK